VATTQEKRKPHTDAARNERIGEVADSDGLDDAHAAVEAALEKKGLEPVLLEVRELCSYASYLLLVSGRSDRQVDAIAEHIRETLGKRGLRPLGVEGLASGHWALLDFGDLIVHIFHHPVREHYDLEGLWIDAPRMPLDIPDEARAGVEDSYT
jgi:ribosome-associated protein